MVEPAVDSDDEEEDQFFIDQMQSGVWDDAIADSLECYLNLPDSENPEQNPLSFAYIREQQQADTNLLRVQQKFPNNFIYKSLDPDVDDIICYVKPLDDPMTQWKIALPESMIEETVHWFHQVMAPPGIDCLRHTYK